MTDVDSTNSSLKSKTSSLFRRRSKKEMKSSPSKLGQTKHRSSTISGSVTPQKSSMANSHSLPQLSSYSAAVDNDLNTFTTNETATTSTPTKDPPPSDQNSATVHSSAIDSTINILITKDLTGDPVHSAASLTTSSTTTTTKEPELGLLSSIFSAAHHTIIGGGGEHGADARVSDDISLPTASLDSESHSEHKSTSFSKKLDFLLAPRNKSKQQIENIAQEIEKNAPIEALPDQGKTEMANISFQPMKDSPLNTLGNGDLSLEALGYGPNSELTAARPMLSPTPTRDAALLSEPLSKSTTIDKRALSPGISRSGTSRSDGKRLGKRVSANDNSPDSSDDIDSSRSNEFASSKRNQEFHQIFPKVEPDDRLIEDYSCALSKDILVQGRMYLSEKFVCFNSNILGWVTNLVIPLGEVVQIEKKSTAVLFPNGMIIRTLHTKHTFASFLQRDATFDTVTSRWKLNVGASGGQISKRSRLSTLSGSSGSESDGESYHSEDDVSYQSNGDEDEDNDTNMVKEGEEEPEDKAITDEKPENSETPGDGEKIKTDNPYGKLLLGPLTHPPTDSGFTKGPSETLIYEGTFEAPLGLIYNLLFGEDFQYMNQILTKQKNFDIRDLTGMKPEASSTRKYSYIKPLSGPVGPKQTKCIVTDFIDVASFEEKCLVTQSSNTPDVPSGGAFTVKTKLVFNWGKSNNTNFLCVTSVEWTGKSWIKGPIEKGTIDGQKESMKILYEEMNSIIKGLSPKSGGGDKKKKRRRATTSAKKEVAEEIKEEAPAPQESWFDSILKFMDYVPLPVDNTIKLGIVGFIMFFLFYRVFLRSSKKISPPVFKDVDIDGVSYKLIPSVNSLGSNRRLKFDTEYEIWEWILNRGGNDLAWLKEKDGGQRVVSGTVEGYKRQEALEKLRLMQERIDEINKYLSG